MKKINAGHPIATSMLLIFIFSLVSCRKDKKAGPVFIPKPEAKQISIASVKALSTEQFVKIKDTGVIRGIVISDARSKNVDNNKTLFIQEGTGRNGIMVKLKMDHNFALNDSLEINIFDQTVTTLNGAVLLQDLANNLVKKVGVGKITPRTTSIRELEANKKEWEGSLIRIGACELISDNGNYSGNMKIKDGKVTIASYINEEAIFNGQELPKDIRSVLGIVRLNGNEVRVAPLSTSEIRPLKYVTDEFTTWKNTAYDINSTTQQQVLYTKFVNWQGDILREGALKQLANAADVSFTKPGKIYPYFPKDSIHCSLKLYPNQEWNLKGMKVLKITFAASKAVGAVYFVDPSSNNKGIPANVLPFNTGIDEVKIGIKIPIESTGEIIPGEMVTPKGHDDFYRVVSLTPSIKEAGKFYTAIFMMPSTMEDLKAMGITSINRQNWLDYPRLEIINLSSRKTPGITDYYRDRYIPILIDKVEIGL
ncbi:DUF5689 domain-containing protein [Pedobacter sp. PLR]|uniref:DUF5689 domain-containing protein n=1 Tax=Pedobacter sp. PLR TaxID=2994465 RepID=UPI002245E711|nr:DUF5689 domain-containing protein [Pedobacter sp. PLR]MCX2454195.1 DUF5689 domain-containing protein [Pedobacter sp. PLR]